MPDTSPSPIGPSLGIAAPRAHPGTSFAQSDLAMLAPYMLTLMLRNVTTAGFVIDDPALPPDDPNRFSQPGAILAAPSYPQNTPGVDQDYVFNWVRDGALTAIEIGAAGLPATNGAVQTLNDYVAFARLCYDQAVPGPGNTGVTKGHACFTIAGLPRPWTEQSDGPALQIVAMLSFFDQLDTAGQQTARALIADNLAYLLSAYRAPTRNLWEEQDGNSFFARAVQLRCFRDISANTRNIAVPSGVADAITWLETELPRHWNGTCYLSLTVPDSDPPRPVIQDYDANIDIVCAAVYGAIPVTDPRLLATASVLRRQWSDPASPSLYPINTADAAQGIGPLYGRYPGDVYDGDVGHPVPGGHPWALSTANVAELHYRLAGAIADAKAVPLDPVSAPFFTDLGITGETGWTRAAATLRAAGDAMLRAIIHHSDRYELSEQFDGTSGYEKSVHNLTWSYASFLSALRARAA